MNFREALGYALAERDDPIVTEYEFYLLGLRLVGKGEWNGAPLKRLPKAWNRQSARNALRRLVERRMLVPDTDFYSGVWHVVQSTRAGSAEEVACIVDPFCYVSHLSAMQRYSLTDRSPDALHVTTPARSRWNEMRDRRMARDLGPLGTALPSPLQHLRFREKVRRRPVTVHESSHPAEPVEIRGERTRITSIGRTFVDMLSEPNLCGGFRHVLEVWEREGEEWLNPIIDAVDAFDAPIVKVRAGHILSERLDIEDDRVRAWERFAQRGGSRRLDPDAPYAPSHSERWMISLNV